MDLNLGLTILIVISFFILVLVFYKLFWKSILENIQQREDSIKSDIEEAKKANALAQNLKEENEKILKDAQKQVSIILKKAKEDAEVSKKDLISKAEEEANNLIVKAKETISQEKEKAKAEIKKEVVDLTILATEKLSLKSISKEDNVAFIEKTLESMSR
ncbi:MAG: ATP synthase F0 subunit B [Candidatus Delongbacteria bacterium]|nr:MAG: ATP synthase F0 subunit B [Candidatus Delongbacteria bacterium]